MVFVKLTVLDDNKVELVGLSSLIELRKVNAAAIRQLPNTSANADVKGMAELSGLMCLFQAHNTLT